MAENGSKGPTDPNEASEPRGNITTPKEPGVGDPWGSDLPVTDTPTPFAGLKDGGSGQA